MIPRSLHPHHFYNRHPSEHIQTGDIWCNLPTFGLLPVDSTAGVVVTPSCDLSNSKVHSITYLPIVAINDWFAMPDFSTEAFSTATACANALSIPVDRGLSSLSTIDLDALNRMETAFTSDLNEQKKEKKRQIAERGQSAVRHLKQIHFEPPMNKDSRIQPKDYLTEREWGSLCQQLIRNAKSVDIHFLPACGDDEWESPSSHSVVLFRYPMTVPARLLELALDIMNVDWSAAVCEVPSLRSLAGLFGQHRPLNTATLRTEYLSDLLTRYTALYNRLGSPDFSLDTVELLQADIESEMV